MNSLEIACTLASDELQQRRSELLPLMLEAADQISDLADGIRMQFAPRPGLLGELSQIIEQEQRCCRFLRFQLTIEPHGGLITFDITGPPGTRAFLHDLGISVLR